MPFENKTHSRTIGMLLTVIVATAGITNIFFANGRVLLPMLPLAVLIAVYPIIVPRQRWREAIALQPQDYALMPFFALSVLAAVMHPNTKSTIYLAVYLFSFGLLGIVLRNIMMGHGNWRRLSFVNLIAVIGTSAFCVLEFSLEFLLNKPFRYDFSLQDYIPRPSPWHSLGYCSSLPRVYGLSNEPTYLGWYFNTLGLIAIVFLWREVKLSVHTKAGLTTIVALAYLLTWSTSTWFVLICGLAISFAFETFRRYKAAADSFSWHGAVPTLHFNIRAFALPLAIVLTFWVVLSLGSRSLTNEIPDCLSVLSTKASLTQEDTVPADATTQWDEAEREAGGGSSRSLPGLYEREHDNFGRNEFQKSNFTRSRIWKDDALGVLKSPFLGRGPGFLSAIDRDSSLNLFLFVAYEQGIPASLALLTYFVVLAWVMLHSSGSPYRWAFIAAYVAGGLHLLTMTQHFYFNLWIMIALFYLSHDLAPRA